ncbi:uncharacterized protein ACIBXB_008170 [Morphnus guianensis]
MCSHLWKKPVIISPAADKQRVWALVRHRRYQGYELKGECLLPCRDAMELWSILGRSSLGVQVLKYLTQKLEAAGENSPGPHSAAHKLDHSQAALESLTLPRAISEVVFLLPAKERVQRLLPRLLPGLLGEISKALGEGMLLAPLRCQRGLFFSASRSEDKPRSPYCEALELVLSRCMEKRWLLLLWRQGAWASLKNPQAHADGVCLLTSVLLRNQLVTRGVIWALSQWLNSPSGNLQLTATAFFAEVRQQEGKEGFRGLLLENCCLGCLFLKEEGARRERHHPMDPMDPRFYEARSRGVP